MNGLVYSRLQDALQDVLIQNQPFAEFISNALFGTDVYAERIIQGLLIYALLGFLLGWSRCIRDGCLSVITLIKH